MKEFLGVGGYLPKGICHARLFGNWGAALSDSLHPSIPHAAMTTVTRA